MAEQHTDMQKLLATISASVISDLPQRIDDLLRGQLAAQPPPLSASAVQSAVQAALSASLPTELSGNALQVAFTELAIVLFIWHVQAAHL